MKVGLLVECGREGLEAIVCRKLCQLIAADRDIEIELAIVPTDNKARLLEEVVFTAKASELMAEEARNDESLGKLGGVATGRGKRRWRSSIGPKRRRKSGAVQTIPIVARSSIWFV